jgi:hypothetical protein
MIKIFCGVDNGVSGYITIITAEGEILAHKPTPIKKELSYTKTKQFINRIDGPALEQFLLLYNPIKATLERPMINPTRWKASMSAVRALEATIIVLELLKIPYEYIDSKEWQKAFLPSGLVKDELKKAAVDVARRLFPSITTKDADSILISEFTRRKYLKS